MDIREVSGGVLAGPAEPVSACCVSPPHPGERLSGEGEGEDVRAVWRNAAVDEEAFSGNQGNEVGGSAAKLCVKLLVNVKKRGSAGGQHASEDSGVRGEDPVVSHGHL